MHWEKFINQLENLHKLSITLGQAMQGTQPVEAANDEEAAGEAMAEKAAASQEAVGPVCRSDSGEQALELLSYRLWTVNFPVITKPIITVNLTCPGHPTVFYKP